MSTPVVVERPVFENAWEVEPGLYRILLPLPWDVPFVNAYVITSGDEWMLIDCGLNWPSSLRALGRALKAIGVPKGGLTYLLLTHRHPDHSGGSGPVHERWGGEVLCHPIEIARWFPGPIETDAWLAEHGVIDREMRERVSAPGRRPEELLPPRLTPLRSDAPLHVGTLTFEVILTPGHAAGHIMLREPRKGWLFLADQVLAAPAFNVWCHPGDEGNPLRDYLESLHAVRDLEYSLLLPGHGHPTRTGFAEAVEMMATFHRRFADQILSLLREHRASTYELTVRLYPEAAGDPRALRFTLSEILAALRYLAGTGLIRRENDGRWQATAASGRAT